MPSRPRRPARRPLTDALPEGLASTADNPAPIAGQRRRKSRTRSAAAPETHFVGDSVGAMAKSVFENDIAQSLVGVMAGTAGGLIVTIGVGALTTLIPVPITILIGTYAGLRLTKSIGN